MTVDESLARVATTLSDAKVRFFVDSGTLLGLIRDGELMEHDFDIDISVLNSSETELAPLRKVLRQKGYKERMLKYRACPFKIKFSKPGFRTVDVNIFYLADNASHYVCPQPVPADVKGPFGKLIAWGVRFVFGVIKEQLSSSDLSNFPWTIGSTHHTWVIPCEYVGSLTDIGGSIMVPEKVCDYLRYRYGDWTSPRQDWDFRRDDGGLIASAPEFFISRWDASAA